MAWLLETLLFALPCLAYVLWRRANPGVEPGARLVLAVALGVLLGLAGLLWFGLSRSLEAGIYVPPHMQDGRLVPGHTEPPAAPPAGPPAPPPAGR